MQGVAQGGSALVESVEFGHVRVADLEIEDGHTACCGNLAQDFSRGLVIPHIEAYSELI